MSASLFPKINVSNILDEIKNISKDNDILILNENLNLDRIGIGNNGEILHVNNNNLQWKKSQLVNNSDVKIENVLNNQILIYDTSSNQWKNQNHIDNGLHYRGLWDPYNNDPVLSSISIINSGDYWMCDREGFTNLSNINEWNLGDFVLYTNQFGGKFQKFDNSEKNIINDTTLSVAYTYSNLKVDQLFNTHSHVLSSLSDIYITSITNNDFLKYDSATNKWKNAQLTASTSAGSGLSLLRSANIFKSLKGTGYVNVTNVNPDELVVEVPKIAINSIQVSDSTTGWTIKEATGSLSFQHNNVPKFIIPSNAGFISGFPSGANTAGLLIPRGSSFERTNSVGNIRYNTNTNRLEFCNNINAWIAPTENTSFNSVQGDDLSLVGATNGQVLMYNGTQWIPSTVSAGGENNTVSNVGGGVGIFKEKVNIDLRFKSLTAGSNITLNTSDPNTIIINNTATGGVTTLTTDSGCPQLSATLTGSNYLLSLRSNDTIRMGANAGGVSGTGNSFGVSIGDNSGLGSGIERLCFGPSAGGTTSFNRSVSIGILAGGVGMGLNAIAIGFQTAYNNGAAHSTNIGFEAGYSNSAAYSLNLGYRANYSSFAGGPSIVLNASSNSLNASNSGFFVQPIAQKLGDDLLCYNTVTKEISHKKDFQALKVVTTNARNSLSNLTVGAIVFNSDTLQIDVWGGSVWRSI